MPSQVEKFIDHFAMKWTHNKELTINHNRLHILAEVLNSKKQHESALQLTILSCWLNPLKCDQDYENMIIACDELHDAVVLLSDKEKACCLRKKAIFWLDYNLPRVQFLDCSDFYACKLLLTLSVILAELYRRDEKMDHFRNIVSRCKEGLTYYIGHLNNDEDDELRESDVFTVFTKQVCELQSVYYHQR